MDIQQKKDGNWLWAVIAGGIIVAAILVLGTVWTGRSARRDMEDAVRKVSLLYLEELAGLREQVVSSTLVDYAGDLDVALGLMEAEDTSSVEKLQAYQARMKQLYGLEKFAFVDNEGLIYTSRGTRTDIDRYDIDYKNISETEISIKNLDGEDKKVIIAVPVDRIPFEGKHLVVCFMEIDIDTMLSGISFEVEQNNATYCNIYTRQGVSLTNNVLGGLASEKDLFSAIQYAEFEKEGEYEKVRGDISEGQEGYISFTYDGVLETLYYVPVRGTDWMLTYLVRESVISGQVASISEGSVQRSLIQSVLTVAVMVLVFAFIIMQNRKTAKLTLEKEVADAENRIKQEELEEQLALQEELLDQEKQRAQQDMMITALASDYRSVYYVDLDADSYQCFRSGRDGDDISKSEEVSYIKAFEQYASQYIDEEYQEGFLDFIRPETIRAGLANQSIIAYRYLVRRDGEERFEMLRMAGVRHIEERHDRMIHAVGVGFTDIDAEMRDSMQKSQALSDALRTAEEASRAKTVFLSNMSHEIRTPMNAIIGLDSLALHEPGISDTTKEYLEKIGSSAQHLLSLINDILDMSRIESGRMSIRNEAFSFSKLLEQVNTIFSGQCQEKGLEYNCHIRGSMDEFFIGDNTKLRQVLINILGNAVKFTPEGGSVDLEVEKTAGFDGKSTLQFVIRDTGIGMSREYLPKIFETFSQEDELAANKYGSSGLGLAITKNIVKMMHGEISVESEKGKGTAFTVTVTLQDCAQKLGDADDEIEIRPQEMSVLVVDDDKVACDHARLILGNAGIATEMALSGKEALEMVRLRHARRDPYHLIVVDWKMPGMDGVETTRRIREEIGDESPIIILTAYNWDDILDEALKAGVDSFIAKPLFSNSLLEEFQTALKKKREAAGEKKQEKKKAQLEGRRILLAEDMAVNAQIMVKVLQMRQMEAEHAVNGKIAVELFANHEPGYYDAVLMDMRMPEMNGLEATMAIRAMAKEGRPDAAKIPIIALTANAFDEDVQRSLQAGLNAHLSKPVQPTVLFETLESMIE